ncbi:MAG: transcriptional repressor [Muribaculaceae bacterium]|nr:transcriptional repressor [Muribaculaceae bacterium]
MKDIEAILLEAGVRPTANRIIVFRELTKSNCPMSLGELEQTLGTLDKSSILRSLSVLLDHHLIHDIEDGRGVIKYELCSGHEDGKDTDMHVHFYCEKCERLICFEDIPVPMLPLPETFSVHAVNYMVKGICPECQ